jgi:hypothetical protein
MRHLTSVTHKATGIFLKLFPLLARNSTLSIPNKITLYKLFIRSVLTYAAPVWSNTSSSNYRRLQILQSKFLPVIGNCPRRTPIPRLHTALNVAPIRDFISHLTDNFFRSCPAHPNPLVCSIGNYTLANLHRQYKKYIHKRPKHLLQPFTQLPQCFALCTCFSLLHLYIPNAVDTLSLASANDNYGKLVKEIIL